MLAAQAAADVTSGSLVIIKFRRLILWQTGCCVPGEVLPLIIIACGLPKPAA
jgi:hypothetical protein